MRLIVLLTCCAIASAGCAQKKIFTKPSFSQAEWGRDMADCRFKAASSTQNVDYGYRTVFGQTLDQAIRRNELIELCLRAKGYSQQGE